MKKMTKTAKGKQTFKQTLSVIKRIQKKQSTPPETGRGWELIFDTVMNVATCECSKTCSLHSKSNYKGLFNQLIALIESSALAKGEKIGAEKERERIRKGGKYGI